jgi:hypothetical protein
MALFPNIPQMFQTADKYGNSGILQRMETAYLDAVTPNQQFWSEAAIDTRFYAGDQTVWNEYYGNSRISNNRQFNFNLIRRNVEMVSGRQRQNRKSTIVVPVANADDHTADQFTKILLWQANQENTLELISDSFTGALITGLNLLQVWMDYRDDPISGDIRISNCSFNTFVIDPYFKQQDLSDCRFLWKRSYLGKPEVASLLPEHADKIMGMDSVGNRDGKFQYMPETYNYNMNNLLIYDEFYYRDYREQKLLVDERTGATMEWQGTDEELKMFQFASPGVSVVNQIVPTVKMAVVVQGQVMYDGPNPLGIDDYPFVPVLAYYTPELPYLQFRIQGMVRCLRDSQYIYNRRKIIELDILESQINSGWIAKENSVIDPKELYKTGQGQVVWRKSDSMPEDLQRLQAAAIDPSMFQASKDQADLIQQISGVNEELLGSATDDKAGVLSMLRQGAGLTTLQRLFDQLDFSQKLLGRIMIKLIQANFTPGKVAMILGEQPSERFFNKNFGKYDAVVEEGFNTSTQRQMQFAQLLNLREVGVPIPSEILVQSATVQDKQQLVQMIQQQEQQQQQMQQAQSQSQMMEQEATLQMAQARAQADAATAAERYSRIEENRALAFERIAEANRDEEQAFLNNVKARKELQDMDLNQYERLTALAHQIKAQEQQEFAQTAVHQTGLMKVLEQLHNNGSMQTTPAAQPPVG